MTQQVNKNIQECADSSFLVIFLWSFLSIVTIFIYNHYSIEINLFLDSLFKLDEYLKLIYANSTYLFGGLVAYLIFLGHIKHTKGLIFGNNNEKGGYATLWLMLFNAFNTFVFPLYLWYLADKYFIHFNWFGLQSVFFIGLFILINTALLNRFQQKIFKGKGFFICSLVWVILLIVASFLQHGYFEMLVLFLVGGILNYASTFLVLTYAKIFNKYEDLMEIQSLQKELHKIIKNENISVAIYNFLIGKETKNGSEIIFFLVFQMNQFFILISFIFAFIMVCVGIRENFNLLSIAYIHFSFILFYYRFTLFSNKFPGLVNIMINGKVEKNVFLVENSKEKVIYMSKKSTFVTSPEKVSFIEIKNIS